MISLASGITAPGKLQSAMKRDLLQRASKSRDCGRAIERLCSTKEVVAAVEAREEYQVATLALGFDLGATSVYYRSFKPKMVSKLPLRSSATSRQIGQTAH